MTLPTTTRWLHLAPDPHSFYRQLFVKGTRIRARVIFGMFANADEPMTPEEIAADMNLPIAAVLEAIAYCQSKPPEIEEDHRRVGFWIVRIGLAMVGGTLAVAYSVQTSLLRLVLWSHTVIISAFFAQ